MDNLLTRTKNIFAVFVLIGVFGGLYSCDDYAYMPPAVDPNATWSFSNDIQPIFTAKCTDASCHGGPQPPSLAQGKSFQALTRGGYVNQPAETSRLYRQVTEDNQHRSLTTPAEKLKILYWITQGAKNN